MKFDIVVDTGKKKSRMQVERIHRGDSLEQFRVSAGGKFIVLEGNRPEILRKRVGKKINWQLIGGKAEVKDKGQFIYGLYQIMLAIEDHMKDVEPKLVDYIKVEPKQMNLF